VGKTGNGKNGSPEGGPESAGLASHYLSLSGKWLSKNSEGEALVVLGGRIAR
jgi:hypothetical protein